MGNERALTDAEVRPDEARYGRAINDTVRGNLAFVPHG